MINKYEKFALNLEYIKINKVNIIDFAKSFEEIQYHHWSERLDLLLSEKEWIILVFIIQSMNFCFWEEPHYYIMYNNEYKKNSEAMFYAIFKYTFENKGFLDINNLLELTQDDLYNIFNINDSEISLLQKRYQNLKESILFMNETDFFSRLFSINSDIEMLEFITSNLSHFNDEVVYLDEVIPINKRATLLVNDLYCVSNTIRNNILSISNLSGCADYVLPRVFKDFNLIEYNKEIAYKIDNKFEIEKDSKMEIELRIIVLYIIEEIRLELYKNGTEISSVHLDNIIWLKNRNLSNKSNSHRTRTYYY